MREALQAVTNLCAACDLYHLIPPLRFAVRFFRKNGVSWHALLFPFDRRVLEYFVGLFGRPDITQELKSLLIPIFAEKFTVRPLSERAAVNVGWCLSFGARRSPDFIREIVRRPIIEFLTANVWAQNDTVARLASHVLSLACAVGKAIAPIENVIDLMGRQDDVADPAIRLCANWAARGS